MPTPLPEKCSHSLVSKTVTSKYLREKVAISTWPIQKKQSIALAHTPGRALDLFYLDVSFLEELYRTFFSFDVFHLSELFR